MRTAKKSPTLLQTQLLSSNRSAAAQPKRLLPAQTAHIVEGLGGAENILNTDNCMTRLRVQVKDAALVKDKEWFKPTGSAGLVVKGNNIQIIYGPKVGKMRAIVDSYLGRAE